MDNKLVGVLISTLLIITVLPIQGTSSDRITQENKEFENYLFQNDAIIPSDIENVEKNLSPGPGDLDQSEYMIGKVAFGIIYLESDGSIDPDLETWTAYEESDALTALQYGNIQWRTWFGNYVPGYYQYLNFYAEINKVTISYEPIIHPSAVTDDTYEKLWVSEAMGKLGYTNGDWKQRVRDYNNHLRDTIETLPGYYGTDWAFTVFLVDNSNDFDSCFSDGYHAYAYLGGPFTVCPYLRYGGPPGPTLKEVFTHELGHIFYATDEYWSNPEYSGYLNALDNDLSGCIMDTLAWCISSGTIKQVGWQDTDGDTILDILDVEPDTTLTPYTPDPSPDTTPTYKGSATVVPSQNKNPHGPGNDITISFITGVEYRVDSGTWRNDVSPDDGNWDETVETFSFTTPELSKGTHIIEARAIDSGSNVDSTPASDSIGIKAKAKNNAYVNTLFLQLLEDYQSIFLILQKFLNRLG